MRRKTVYIETSILSYATARPSGLLMVAAQQQHTQVWLERFPRRFDGFVSQLVLDEAADGDPEAAARRLRQADRFTLLGVTQPARALGRALLGCGTFPPKAIADAVHVGIAAVHGMDFLVTWNCTHINNALIKPKIEQCCAEHGHRCPVICTPLELEVDGE